MPDSHVAVLLEESINALNIKPDGIYVDLTLGRAGHSSKILTKLTTGHLFAFDKDASAIQESMQRLSSIGSNFSLIHADFKNFKQELANKGISHVDGILVDLGVSSPQLDNAERGFSYSKNARLDMRMDQSQELDAHYIVNSFSEEELAKIFRNYADVMLPQRVAKGIIANRPINSTLELVDVIRKSLPAAVVRKKNPAKAVFQAIRIAVNNELESLETLLETAPSILNASASLAIITFHSIEDKIVKKSFATFVDDKTGKLPIIIEKK